MTLLTRDGFARAFEYLYRNTKHKEFEREDLFRRMSDYFDGLSDFFDDQVFIGAQRWVLMGMGDGWLPLIGEWRRAIIEWLALGFDEYTANMLMDLQRADALRIERPAPESLGTEKA